MDSFRQSWRNIRNNIFKEWKNITIVDNIVIKEFIETNNKYKFTFTPFVPDGRFKEALNTKECEWKDSNCIFSHQLINNAKIHISDCYNLLGLICYD